MGSDAKQIICNGLKAFESTIKFETTENPSVIFKNAINSDPKIVYYLHWSQICGAFNHYELRAQYIHKDTPISDIKVVNSEKECIQHMCNSVGNYQKKLIVVVPNVVDLSKVTNEFHVKHTVFYPNLTSISTMGYHPTESYTVYEFGFNYRIGQVKLNMMESEVDKEVMRISKMLFSDDMPIEAKIYLAHNYLASTVTYVDNNKNNLDTSYTQSAYGALIKHECVCQGYAEAFKRILDFNKINCEVVSGQIIGSTEYHAWNIVSLGKPDSYFHIDVTWDSASNHPQYLYFTKSDAQFAGKRTWNRELTPACSAKYAVLGVARKYVFLNKNRLLAKGIDRKIIDC